MTPTQQYYKNASQGIIKNFTKRNIEGYYVSSKQEACQKALSFIQNNDVVTFGGSMTIEEIGLLDAISKLDNQFIDRRTAKTLEEKEAILRKAYTADIYFMSSNAITLDGQLVNIDGTGNRVSALSFGPKNVIIIAGMNKIATNVDEAINRVQNVASPQNSVRLQYDTPCSKTGTCQNCFSKDCICCQITITRFSRIQNRIKVILVGESLGY